MVNCLCAALRCSVAAACQTAACRRVDIAFLVAVFPSVVGSQVLTIKWQTYDDQIQTSHGKLSTWDNALQHLKKAKPFFSFQFYFFYIALFFFTRSAVFPFFKWIWIHSIKQRNKKNEITTTIMNSLEMYSWFFDRMRFFMFNLQFNSRGL